MLLKFTTSLSNILFTGYTLSIILFYIAYILFPSSRLATRKLITLSNAYLLLGALLFLILSILNTISYADSENAWERLAIYNSIWGEDWTWYWGETIFKSLIPQLFWINHLRRNLWFPIIIVISILVGHLWLLLYSLNRAFLGFNWAISLEFTDLILNLLIFGFLLMVSYIFTRDKNSLNIVPL